MKHASCRVSEPRLVVGRVRRPSSSLALLVVLAAIALSPSNARAGGQGANLPPYPLPVRESELRLATQARMVCVTNPGIVCNAPYLDAHSNSQNSDGGTFRSASCPGTPPGACRPDFIPNAELTGELVVDWPIVRSTLGGVFPPPDPEPGISCDAQNEYKICQVSGLIELNVTAPGVVVSNPILVLDSTMLPGSECECIEQGYQLEASFAGEEIEQWWVTRNVGPTCDVALEYASFIPRDQIRDIGQQAFPDLLCKPDGLGVCQFNPDPIFVEPDGSLTKGCGEPPSSTFTIRFAMPNEPLAFERKALPASEFPTSIGDVNDDDKLDFMAGSRTTVFINDGNNNFSSQATGLAPGLTDSAIVDWTDDGVEDLVISVSSELRIYPGDGSGTFSEASSFLASSTSFSRIQIADFNGDGLQDALGSTGRLAYNETNGPISPALETFSIFTDGIADLDGDSRPNVLGGTNFPERVQWTENQGPGSIAVVDLLSFPDGDALVPLLGQELVDLLQCESPFSSNCCSDKPGTGCDDTTCETAVCAEDSFCCDSQWDETCAEIAGSVCSVCIDPALPDCCSATTGTPGCESPSCESIVCDLEPICCSNPWDADCAGFATAWCQECQVFDVSCSMPNVEDVAGADVEGDGDTDLVLALEISQNLDHPRSSPNVDPRYLFWLPNRQVEDPVTAAGNPLFDPALSPWQLLGPGGTGVEIADLDSDGDPDVIGHGFWYRNDAGSFKGPYGLRSAAPDVYSSSFDELLYVADTDNDSDLDIVIFDAVYERVPEPSTLLGLGFGSGLLVGLSRRRWQKARRP
jgi:hypothetical protein